jgi:hypothetical protein
MPRPGSNAPAPDADLKEIGEVESISYGDLGLVLVSQRRLGGNSLVDGRCHPIARPLEISMSKFQSWTVSAYALLPFAGLALLGVALGIANPVAAAISHSGATDPAVEGWVTAGAAPGVIVGPAAPDPDFPGVSSWSVDDASTASGSAVFYQAPTGELPAVGQAWHLHARLRVADPSDATDMGVFLEVTDPFHRRYLLVFGSDDSSRINLVVSTTGTATGSPNDWLVDLAVPEGALITEYVNVDLVYDGVAADLFVNGQQLAGGLVGYVATSVPTRVLWGAGSSAATGHGRFAEIRFELDSTPECSNGLDDDGDALSDFSGGDPDCAGPFDPLERPPVVPCDDGVDRDYDGLCDVDELRIGTDATSGDSDGDGLSDADEYMLYGTNPNVADTDGDGFDDGVELAAGRDPKDPLSGPPPVPSWDYSMPSRFVARDPTSPDQNGDRYFVGDIRPATWTVDFDACATGGLVFEYRWYVDGAMIENRSVCSGFQQVFPGEGNHDVRLVTVGTAGEQAVSESGIVVQDLLIFGLGDSYGSGEGNPDSPVTAEMLLEYEAFLDAVDAAEATVQDAYADWQAQLAFNASFQFDVAQAWSAYQTWLNKKAIRDATCPLPLVACAAAQLETTIAAEQLLVALVVIGISSTIDFTNAVIADAINAASSAAEALVAAAESVYHIAANTLANAQQTAMNAQEQLIADWQHDGCHRSAFSGQVLAAQRLEATDPHTSVTFIHLACSGAQITGGSSDLIGDDADPLAAQNNSLQVNAMRTLAEGHTIDGVFLSIGGNDASFANLIMTCVETEPCHLPNWTVDPQAIAAVDQICALFGWLLDTCDLGAVQPAPGEDAATLFATAKARLAPRYESLHFWLEGEYPRTAGGELNTLGRIVDPGRVFLTEYPDFTRNDVGEACGWVPGEQIGATNQNMPGVSQPEHVWAGDIVSAELKAEMDLAAGLYGWNFVTEISSAFSTHGYCATDPWIVRVGESLSEQADPQGIVHPDQAGHVVYANALETEYVPEPGFAISLMSGFGLLLLCHRRRRTRAD